MLGVQLMLKKTFAILSGLTLTCGVAWGQGVGAKDRFEDAYKELRSRGLVEG